MREENEENERNNQDYFKPTIFLLKQFGINNRVKPSFLEVKFLSTVDMSPSQRRFSFKRVVCLPDLNPVQWKETLQTNLISTLSFFQHMSCRQNRVKHNFLRQTDDFKKTFLHAKIPV